MTEFVGNKPNSEREIVRPIFDLPIVGRFSRMDVVINDSCTSIYRPPDIQQVIDDNWALRLQEVNERGGSLEDRQKVLLLNRAIEDDRLIIGLGRDYYRNFVGTYFNQEIRQNCPDMVPQLLSVTALLETSDNYLVLNKRSQAVFQYPGWISGLGGPVEADDVNERGEIDPFVAAIREISEETGIDGQQVVRIECTGFMRDLVTGIEDMTFFAQTVLTREEIETAQVNIAPKEGESVFMAADGQEIQRVLAHERLVSDAAALLTLFGKLRPRFPDDELV